MKSKKKLKFIEIIKSDKKIRYFTIYSVLILFICVIGFSLSVYTRANYDNAANFTINGLSYLINTNAGGSNDRILELDAGKTEKFAVSIISKNTMDTKYELLYEVCADSSCSSVLSSLDENVKIGFDASLTNQLSGTIAKNETKSANLITQNNTSNNVYIRLVLNAGYGWNDLALSNQIQALNLSSKVINIDKYLYNEKTTISPSDCSTFTMTGVKAYNGSSLISGTNSGINVSCSSDVWTSTFSGFPTKIEYYYENELLLQNDTERPKCSLSVSGTTINATYSDNVAVAYHGWDSSYSGPKSASKSINATGTYTFYVMDYKENKNSCSLSVISTYDETYSTTCTRNLWVGPATNGKCRSGWYSATGWNGPGCYTTRDVACEEKRKACSSGYSMINDSYCYKIN